MWVPALIYAVVSIVLWQFANAVFVPELVANRLFEILPVAVIEAGVQAVGPLAKQAAFVAVGGVYFGAYWWFSTNWARVKPYFRTPAWAAVGLWTINVLVLFPATGKGVFGYKLPQGALGASVFLFVAHWMFGRMLQMQPPPVYTAPSKMGRRIFVGGFALAVVAGLVKFYRVLVKPKKWSEALTPTEEFYTVSKNSVDPVVPETGWRLELRGLFQRPATFTLQELREIPATTMAATLACISNPVGGEWVGNAMWTGLPFGALLASAGIDGSTKDIVLHAADGYTDSIPLERAMHPLCLLAYEMNGAPLTSSHGFPLRLIVPGIYGMKNVKWITAIVAVSQDYLGFWQQKGWDDAAQYKIICRIDIASHGVVAGIAFAGDRGISAVQLKIGDGPWQEADLEAPMSPLSWVRWRLYADVKGKGVMARAVGGNGEMQIAQPRPPFPAGSSGFHTVVGA